MPALEGQQLIYQQTKVSPSCKPRPRQGCGWKRGDTVCTTLAVSCRALQCQAPVWLSCDAAGSFLSYVSCCPRNRGKNSSREALLLHLRQHLLSLTKTVYGHKKKPCQKIYGEFKIFQRNLEKLNTLQTFQKP